MTRVLAESSAVVRSLKTDQRRGDAGCCGGECAASLVVHGIEEVALLAERDGELRSPAARS
ncbi:hypothetical protein [Nonomuraea sp. NPDC005650]|uniref:hypothetical protein n=1 Tax=Nonomuraea sp. NPDC005650 TaxID=3157045 RepID=UPI0033B99C16